MENLTKDHREELINEWKGIYPTANELLVLPGHARATQQTPDRVPITENNSIGGTFKYCYDFKTMAVYFGEVTSQIEAITNSDPTFNNKHHRILFGIGNGKYNQGELIRLERFLAGKDVPLTVGYTAGGRTGSPRQLGYVSIPALGHKPLVRDFVFV